MSIVVPGPFGLNTWHAPGDALGAKLFPLKTPSENSAPNTTAMMSIAHPYVIRYSIADCDFSLEWDMDARKLPSCVFTTQIPVLISNAMLLNLSLLPLNSFK
jgi:hypothetical protein